MTASEMLNKIDEILGKAKTGILASIDNKNQPHMRWMTPSLINGRPGSLFAVTSPFFAKIVELDFCNKVQWMIQTPSLKDIITINGTVTVIDNPALKAEILEAIGKKLFVFWNVNPKTDFVVLETIIHEATWFSPMKNTKEKVTFIQEN
jgi:pyridoxamine 5'-phosphate oxidase